MNEGLHPQPVYKAGKILADNLGLDWCEDRAEVLDYLNELREIIYAEYPKLFHSTFYCLEVECFPLDCVSTCSCGGDTYWGVTVPSDIDGVTAVWLDHEPMRMYSKWWEGRSHRHTKTNGDPLTTVQMPQTSPLQKPMKCPDYLSFLAHSPEDAGKEVYLKYRTEHCKTEECKVTLACDMVQTPDIVHGVESIMLPDGLVDCVSVYQGTDYELSCYTPFDTVPCFKRLKIQGEKCKPPCKILLQGSQKYRDLCFDTDISEIGSRAILKQAGLKFRYGDRTADNEQLARGLLAEDRMNRLIRQSIERHRGNAKEDPTQFNRRTRFKKPSLYRKRCKYC